MEREEKEHFIRNFISFNLIYFTFYVNPLKTEIFIKSYGEHVF